MVNVNIFISQEAKTLKLKNPVLLVGFPSPGLVGSISAVHLTEGDDFKLVGYIWGDNFAPVAAVHDYSLMPPVRIMASEEKNLIVVLSEISIPLSATAKVAEAIVEVAKKFKAKEIAVMSSINETSKSAYYSANSPDMERKLKLAIKSVKMKEGAISGVGPLVMIKATERKMPAYILMVPSMSSGADAKASSRVLKMISNIYDIKIDTSELDKEAEKQEGLSDIEEESTFGKAGMYR